MYHSAQFQATHRFAKGVSFNVAYTYGKSMDNGTSYQTVWTNAYDNSFFWGPSTFDRREVWQMTGLYSLPLLRGANHIVRGVAGGWQISAVYIYQSGTPFSVGTTTDYAGVNLTGQTQYWVQNSPIQVTDQYSQSGTSADSNFYFQPKTSSGAAVWTAPPNGTFNKQLVRDAYYGPGSWNLNSALYKTFQIHEKIGFTLRWEQYDTLNHPNWSGPNTTPTNAAFGKITAKSGNRDQQLALRFTF